MATSVPGSGDVMRCDEMDLDRYALVDGELDGARREAVLSHLAICARCQHEYEADRRLNSLLREALAPSPPVPPALWSTVVGRIAHEPRIRYLSAQGAGPIGGRPRQGWGLTAAAIGLVAWLFAALLLLPGEDVMEALAQEIVADHLASLRRARGPADVPLPDPAVVIDRFQDRLRIPARVPASAREGVRLVGGSFCQFSSTRGLRWSYVRGEGRALSFYQLERPAGVTIPHAGAELVHQGLVGAATAPIVLWGDDQSLYALVGELPSTEIERLAPLL
jgi:anti-sigma factor RsiW